MKDFDIDNEIKKDDFKEDIKEFDTDNISKEDDFKEDAQSIETMEQNNTENISENLQDEPVDLVIDEKKEKKTHINGAKIALYVFCILICCSMLFLKFCNTDKTSLPTSTHTASPDSATEPLKDITSSAINKVETDVSFAITDVSSIVEKVLPSVVSISSLNKPHSADFNKSDKTNWKKEEEMTGSASGVIIGDNDEEIWILTNAHVIADAKSILVTFFDNTDVLAYVKGSFEDNDIAVISVKISDLKKDTLNSIACIPLGDSSKSKIGEGIIAVGNSLGYGQSVTTGIISATNREITVDNSHKIEAIQIDAAINPGNSGGALINTKGEFIGIPTAKSTASYTEGMGFAIPINSVKEKLQILCSKSPRLYATDKEAVKVGVNITDTYLGIMIFDISDDSIAQRSELEVGDIIKEVNGAKISTSQRLVSSIRYFRKGETLTFKIQRPNGKEYKTVNVSIKL